MTSENKILKSSINLIILNVLGNVITLVREMQIASIFGTSNEYGIYILILSIIATIFMFITPIFSIFVSQYFKSDNKDQYIKFIFKLVALIAVFVSIVTYILSIEIAHIYLKQYSYEQQKLGTNLLRGLILLIIFMAMNNFISSYLQLYKKFSFYNITSTIQNCIIVIFTFALSNIDIYKYSVIYIGSFAIQTIILLIYCNKNGFHVKNFIDKDVKLKSNISSLNMYLISIVGGVFYQFNSLYERKVVSGFGIKKIAYIAYSQKINDIVIGIVMASIMTVVFPYISEAVANKSLTKEKLQNSIKILFYFCLWFIVVIFYTRVDIIKMLFMHGKFNSMDLINVSYVSGIMVFFVVIYALKEYITRVMISINGTKMFTYFGVSTTILNIFILRFFSANFNYVIGIVSYMIGCTVFIILADIYFKRFEMNFINLNFVLDICKVTLVFIICYIYKQNIVINSNIFIRFVCDGIVLTSIYFFILISFDSYIRNYAKKFTKRLRKGE